LRALSSPNRERDLGQLRVQAVCNPSGQIEALDQGAQITDYLRDGIGAEDAVGAIGECGDESDLACVIQRDPGLSPGAEKADHSRAEERITTGYHLVGNRIWPREDTGASSLQVCDKSDHARVVDGSVDKVAKHRRGVGNRCDGSTVTGEDALATLL